MPERIQLRRTKGWRLPDGAIRVARPTQWGNPFRVDDPWMTWAAIGIGLRADKAGRTEAAVRFYRSWMTGEPVATEGEKGIGGHLEFGNGDVVSMESHVRGIALTACGMYDSPTVPERPELTPLRDHDLACWCPVGTPCHAEVLLELANA